MIETLRNAVESIYGFITGDVDVEEVRADVAIAGAEMSNLYRPTLSFLDTVELLLAEESSGHRTLTETRALVGRAVATLTLEFGEAPLQMRTEADTVTVQQPAFTRFGSAGTRTAAVPG